MSNPALKPLRLAIALAAVFAAPPNLVAQESLSFDTWHYFEWFDGTGPIDGPDLGFFLTALAPTRLRITDAFLTGDAFDVFVNGSLLLSTVSVLAGIDTGTGDGESAWMDGRLSRGELFLGAGEYRIEIAVREDAGFGYGEGFIHAEAATVTPEPVSLLLLGSGLAGMAVARRRRRKTE